MQPTDAVLAKRADDGPADTDEIRALAEAAGHSVVGEVTQTRAEHPGLQFGPGKADELAATVAATGAATVVFDNELTPTQTCELAARCPDGTAVVDRYRLVLDIFEEQAGSKRATLQAERAKLAWDLPRIRESDDEQAMNRFTESGTRYYDVRDRIDELTRKLDDLADDAATRRERRREEGFEFVALVGYTNAGKSTLLHRLADDLDFAEREGDHADLSATAEIEDRLFKTLETTTRRATVGGHRTLATDTVGFVDDVPTELVESFHGTLSASHDADCVALVVDAADPPAELRRKLETCLDLLGDEGAVPKNALTVFNKVDLLDADERRARADAVADLAPDPVAVSATEGDGLDELENRIAAALPDLREATLELPNDGEAMSLVSWLYDRADVEDVTYADDVVRIEFAGEASVVERAEARARKLSAEA